MTKPSTGFWNYTNLTQFRSESVRDWHDLSMSFAMSPGFNPARNEKAKMLAMLGVCKNQG